MSQRDRLRAQQVAAAKAAQQRRIVWIGAGVVALVLAIVVGVVIFTTAQQGGGTAKPPNTTAKGDAFTVAADKAAASAPSVELYFDYQCPGCKAFDDTFGSQLVQLARDGKIKFSLHPLTFLERFGAGKSVNPTIGAACADIAGALPEYHLAVFKNQPATEGAGYTTEQLRVTIPTQAGITGDKLKQYQACYDTRATATWVTDANKLNSEYTQAQAATNEKWAYTPAFAVNGKLQDYSNLPTDATQLLPAITKMAG